jgi:hypothetical protein
MNIPKLESWVSRLFFAGAFLLLVVALVERYVYAFVRVTRPITMLYMAVVLLVFVIAIQLRALREELKGKP